MCVLVLHQSDTEQAPASLLNCIKRMHLFKAPKQNQKWNKGCTIAEQIMYHKIDKELTVHTTVLFEITALEFRLTEPIFYSLKHINIQ